jgi:hypothetical protein
MATITTKYSIGETVYFASTVTETKCHPCPDCLGKKIWTVTSPAGTDYTFPCPRCSAHYSSNDELRLDYSRYAPVVRKMTIGSIKHDSAYHDWDKLTAKTQYMCRETGVGSGSVYDEDLLFPTEEEAMQAAQLLASEQNLTTHWVVQRYNKTLAISDYQLANGKIKLAADATFRASSMLWNLADLFSRIEEARNKDEIREAVEEYKTYDWRRDTKELPFIEALEFYANPEIYKPHPNGSAFDNRDLSFKAKSVLAELGHSTEQAEF